MDDLQPPDSPHLLYEDPQHWELEAKNKDEFRDHFLNTNLDNLHISKGVRHDFYDLFIAAENVCRRFNKWVDNVETQELKNMFRVLEFLIKNPYTNSVTDIRTRIRIRPFLHTVLSHC